MPNHITNIVRASGKVLESMRNDEGFIDFNKVIPTPGILHDTEFHSGIVERAKMAVGMIGRDTLFVDKLVNEKASPEDVDNVIKSISCYKETGYFYWYDWNVANWGTKWNAYSQEDYEKSDSQLAFETAWCYPEKVAKALSEKFPDEEITWIFADEDLGSNCGTIIIKGGEFLNSDCAGKYKDMSQEERTKWRAFAFKLRYPNDSPTDHGMDENYNYVENED